jgi:hypothetical protein
MSEPLVTLAHVRALNYCSRGLRAFFLSKGLDWNTFRTTGLPADVIEATGDDMAIKAAALARQEAADALARAQPARGDPE